MANDVDADVGLQLDAKEALAKTRELAKEISDIAFQVSKINAEFKKTGVTIGQIASANKGTQVKALLGTVGSAGSTVDAKAIKAAQQVQKEQFDTSKAGQYISAVKELQRIESSRAGVAKQYLTNQGVLLKGEEQFIKLKKEQAQLEQKIFDTLTKQKNQFTDKNLAAYTKRVKEIQSQLQDYTPTGQKKAVPLTREERIAQQRQDTQDRLFSDGGAALLAIQNRLLINYKVLAAAYSSVGFIKNFVTEIDDALAQLQSITGSTNTQMIGLKTTILEVAEASRFSTNEIAKAATTLAQAGFSSDQIKLALKSIVDLAQATGSTLADSVNLTTTVLSVFNIQAEKTSFVADVITNALNQSKASVENLSLGLQYSANIAADAQVNFVELTAALSTLTNQGIKSGSTIGTGTRQLITDLENPSQKMIQRLAQLGLTAQDIDLKIKGLSGVLKTLSQAGFTTADALDTMELRAASVFSALQRGAGQFETFQTSLLISGAAAEASSKRMESLSSKVANFQNVFGEAADKGIKPFLDILKGVVDGATLLFKTLNEYPTLLKVLVNSFLALAGAVVAVQLGTLLANLTGFKIIIGGIATAIATFISVIRGATTVLLAFSLAARGLLILTGVGAVIAAVATAFALLGDKSEEAAEKLEKAKTASSDAAAETEKHTSRVKQLTDFIDQLDAKQGELTQGSAALNSQIINAQIQFAGLSGKVDLATNSYEGLRASLIELLKVEKERRRYALTGENAKLRDQLSIVQEELKAYDTAGELRKVIKESGVQKNFARAGFSGLNDEGKRFDFSPSASKALGDLEEAIKNNAKPEDLNRAIGAVNDLLSPGGELAGYKKVSSDLNNRIQVATNLIEKSQQAQALSAQINANQDAISSSNYFNSDAAKDIKSAIISAGEEIKAKVALSKESTATASDKAKLLAEARDQARDLQKKYGAGGSAVPVELSNSEDLADLLSENTTKALGDAIPRLETFTNIGLDDLKTSIDEQTATINQKKAELSNASVSDQKRLISEIKTLVGARAEAQKEEAKQKITKEVQGLSNLTIEEQTTFINDRLAKAERKIDAEAAAALEKSSGAMRTVSAKFTDGIRSLVDLILDSVKEAQILFERARNEARNVVAKTQAEFDSYGLRKNRGKLTPGQEVEIQDRLESVKLAEQRRQLDIDKENVKKLEEARDQLLKAQNISKDKFQQYQKQGFDDKDTAKFAGSAIGTQKTDYNKAVKGSLQLQEQIDKLNQSIAENTIQVDANSQSRDTNFTLTENLKYAWSAFADTVQDSNDKLTQLAFIDTFNAIKSSFEDMFTSFVTGTKTASQAFKDFAISIIKSMAEIAAKRAAAGLLDLFLGSIGGLFGGTNSAGSISTHGIGVPTPRLAGNAAGGYITGGVPGRDSVIAKVMPGEYISKKSTVDALGSKFFADLDTKGKKSLDTYNSTTVINQGSQKQVNVYVVSPDNVPSMGPDDVIATVGDNIQRGGPLKKLIKSVVI